MKKLNINWINVTAVNAPRFETNIDDGIIRSCCSMTNK